MSETKFTPGPWEVAHAGEGTAGGKFRITEYYVRMPGADFALAADIVDADMKPSEANAHLIAAAPDMLIALCIYQHAVESGMVDADMKSAYRFAESVISKATP